MNNTIEFIKSPESKQIVVKSSYQHSLETIWNAFTKTEILEKWWAPEPYKAVVVSNNFEKGKSMFYYMLSPEGQKHYCIAEFLAIDPMKSYEVLDAFCDENALINTEFPRMTWLNTFSFENGITRVTNTISSEKAEDILQILELGFEEGYKMGLNQLYKLLNQK
jgi:Uncharacterized conserved protein